MVVDLQGRTSLERRLRFVSVVLDSVLFSQQLGLLHWSEQLNIREFIPEAAIERLYEWVLPW